MGSLDIPPRGRHTRSVPGARWRVDQLVDDVARLGRRGLPRDRYFGEVAARLRRVLDCDATCWHTVDPHTRLMTSDAPQELISEGVFTPESAPDAGAMIVASEYFVQDVNTLRMPTGMRRDARLANDVLHPRASRSSYEQHSSVAVGAGARSTSPGARTGKISAPRTRTRSRNSPPLSLTASAPRFGSTPPAKQRTTPRPGSSSLAPATRSS